MDDEFEFITIRHAFAAVFVAALGWGIAWNGGYVAKLAWNNSEAGRFLFATEQSVAGVLASVEETPLSESPAIIPSAARSSLEEKTEKASSLSIMIGGDVMFDRKIRHLGEQKNYESLLVGIAPLFKKADVAVVNLEGPITSSKSRTLLPNKTTTKDLTFTFDPKTAVALASSGITAVNLANNHTDNFGLAGLSDTKKNLSKAGVQWFGNPWNSSPTEAVITKNGISVALVGYHSFQKGFDRVLADVRRLSASGHFVIVTPHWGEEYVSAPSADLQSKARFLVAAGADAVVGSHSHVIMDHVWMGDVPVFYSLGNLLFDQYFSPEVMKGNVVELHLVKSEKGAILDSLKIYETSTASRTGVTLVE